MNRETYIQIASSLLVLGMLVLFYVVLNPTQIRVINETHVINTTECELSDLDYRLYEMELVINSLKNYSFMEEELQEFQFLQMILNKFAENHEYDRDDYNCQHFAKDIDFIYTSLGYDVTYDGGYNEGATEGHMWNDITISIDAGANKVGYFNDKYDFQYEQKELTNLKVIRGGR